MYEMILFLILIRPRNICDFPSFFLKDNSEFIPLIHKSWPLIDNQMAVINFKGGDGERDGKDLRLWIPSSYLSCS